LKTSKTPYPELELINKLVFQPCEFIITDLEKEPESQEYFAHQFQIGKQNVKFRTAKITPTKTGQFVTIWKRNPKGITEPFDIYDDFYFYIIATRKDEKFGLFIFPKTVLHEHGILSDKVKEGKRGIRVYPPWDVTTNKQAQKTQSWQVNFFIDLSNEKKIDLEKVKGLFRREY
jgi:hypothetical protein